MGRATKEQRRAQNARYRAKHPEKDFAWQLKRHYGLTVEEYQRLNDGQGGVCAICGDMCQTERRLSVDHDHETGRVRGLLCMNCNQGLGKFKDDPERLSSAIRYLGG